MKKLLMVIPLVFLLCFAFSCQDKDAMAEVEEQNKELVKRYVETFNERNS